MNASFKVVNRRIFHPKNVGHGRLLTSLLITIIGRQKNLRLQTLRSILAISRSRTTYNNTGRRFFRIACGVVDFLFTNSRRIE
uniref:Uncharacterized protein n=1 Tax=Romanomermis culicivorax TaxID=13658 RepID=A0A915J8D3_ROMCU